jgi:hypothetical protein
MSVRQLLPTRRGHTVLTIEFAGQKYHVGYGQEIVGKVVQPRVVEVFADAKRTGSDSQAQLADSCIAISLLLQHGLTMKQIAEAFGESRSEGMASGPPSSILGCIARAGVALEIA